MTSLQLLLLNLLYDVLCIILPWDNVDEEENLSPRDWSGKTLGRFMLSFGPISSLFDIAPAGLWESEAFASVASGNRRISAPAKHAFLEIMLGFQRSGSYQLEYSLGSHVSPIQT